MLYTVHTIKSAKHTDIAPEGAINQDELKSIIAYAGTIILRSSANQESLGDAGNPQAAGLSRRWPITRQTLLISPVKETTYTFLKDLYQEMIPLYEYPAFCVAALNPRA